MFLVPSLWPKQFFHIWLNGNKDRLWWLAVSWERWVNVIAIRVDIFQQVEHRERQILLQVVTSILGQIGKFCLLRPPSIQNIQWVFQTVKCSECWLLWQSCEHNIRWINKNNNFLFDFTGVPHSVVYCATKHALQVFTRLEFILV